MSDYHVGKFVVIDAVDKSEPDELVTDVLKSKVKSTNTAAKKAQQSGQKS